MTNNIIKTSKDFTVQLLSSVLCNQTEYLSDTYHNYINNISSNTNRLEELVRQYPSSILFNNPRLILTTASNIVDQLKTIPNLKQIHKLPLYFNINCPDPLRATSIKWWQYQLNKESRRDFEMLHYHFHKVSCHNDKYASKLQVKSYLLRMKSTDSWMKRTFVGKGDLTLAQCTRSNYARFSELYTILKGLNTYADNLGYHSTFITITAPPEFHSTPVKGGSKWDGSSPRDTNAYFAKGWHKMQAVLSKNKTHYFGIRLVEPHHDGSNHWHLMILHKENDFDTIINALKFQFYGENQVNVKRNNGKSTAASYISKYIPKSKNLDGDDSTTSAVSAWRSCWGLRTFQFFGIEHQITKWRELRKIKKHNSALWKAASVGDFASYLSLLKSCTITLLKDVSENKYGGTYKKVIGISIDEISYITHSKYELLTHPPKINKVELVPNYSSNNDNYDSEKKPILTRINSPPTQ